MTQEQRLNLLPSLCDKVCRKNSQSNQDDWIDYKLHIDTIDGDIPVSAVLTSASVHDSLAVSTLGEMICKRVNNLYSLMDAAYNSAAIKNQIRSKGKVTIVDHTPRREEEIKMPSPEKERYKARSSSERVNSYLKDAFEGRELRVRGSKKVMMSLISLGLLVIASQ